jgi:hypothetical protein
VNKTTGNAIFVQDQTSVKTINSSEDNAQIQVGLIAEQQSKSGGGWRMYEISGQTT